MDSLGIEIKEGSWTVVHLRSTPFSVRLESHVQLTGASHEERLNEFNRYIESHGIKNPRIAVGLPRRAAISRTIEVPAPDSSSVEGIIKYELEKHFPFGPEDSYYGHQVLKSEKNIFSVFLVASRKEDVDGVPGTFGSAGLKPVTMGAWQEALFNALFHLKKLPPEKNVAVIAMDGGWINIEVFSNASPIYSKCSEGGGPGPEELINTIKRELRLALSSERIKRGKIDEVSLIFGTAEDGLPEALAKATGLNVSSLRLDGVAIPSSTVPAFGLALMAAGRSKLNINLAPGGTDEQASRRYALTAALAGLAALLLVSVEGSYLLRDAFAIRRLESAISDARTRKEKVETILGSLKASEDRIRTLDGIKGSYPTASLDILKELTEILPAGTWLTGFEYSDGLGVIDGFSDRSSALILKMENSRLLKDIEFTGPVTKSGNGKEHFRIRFSVAGKATKQASK